MPFSADFTPVYEAIRDAVQAPDVGFACRRADELVGGDQIMIGVLREIARAQLIVSDLTGRNPNVFYELGVAHMTKEAERVLLITQRMDDVPFDIRAYRCILYASGETGLRSLGDQVAAAAKVVAGRTYRFSVSSEAGHRTGPMFPGADRYLYSLEVCQAMIGMGFVKCLVRVWRHGIGVEPEKVEESAYGFGENETRDIGCFPWAIRLDRATDTTASFAVVPRASARSD
jgi:hypothetical protein